MRGARAILLCAALLAGACATPPSAQQRAQSALHGIRTASAHATELLDNAAAWAVFPDVQDTGGDCSHEGLLFVREASMRACRLRCLARTHSPAGVSYHQVVVLLDALDPIELESGALDLAGAARFTTHGEPDPAHVQARRWVITTPRGTVLFDAHGPHQTLEVVRQ